MAERKRARRRKDEYSGPGEQKEEKPTKIEYTVAKWLKSNIKTKKTKFLQHSVEYFTASKAVDGLLESKFATGKQPLFTTREAIVEFLDVMLEHKFFHRAKKVPVLLETGKEKIKDKPKEKSKDKDKEKEKDKGKDKEKEKEKDKDKENNKDSDGDGANAAGSVSDAEKRTEKRKRKIRLDMHAEQIFVDGSDAYVWIFDPIPLHYWIIGFVVVLAAIGICLFPLWPSTLRQGVYYLSVAGAAFLVFMILLSIIRLIIFTLVWLCTIGRLHFWIFPNLAEDVGFFASFWPLYDAKYDDDSSEKTKNGKKSKTKSKKKQKDSDAENDDGNEATNDDDQLIIKAAEKVELLAAETIDDIKEHDADDMVLRQRVNKTEAANEDTEEDDSQHSNENSEGAATSKEGSQRDSQSDSEGTSKDFEIINTAEVQNVNL